ncbi:MAG: hypothetical protein HYR66_15640 [Sphingobacteriales bacterium]|nr:hypothetical protein [Sphingobacteriales bacterium]MBI3716983.1 hypothetical protein [Sphingobacteriales bacterium]
MNIGLLYPGSAMHPSISMEFMDGLKSCLKLNRLQDTIKITAETAGYGGVEKEVKEKVEKLLVVHEADILILYLDQKILTFLKPVLEASGKLIIVVNPGADYPQSWQTQGNIIHLNLNHAFLCWLTGELAVSEPGANAAVATSFYDCGYLHGAMMVNNFTIHGGNIMFNYVNNQAYNNSFHIDELLAYLAGDKLTSKLLCIYDDIPAALFYSSLNNYADADRLQLYVSPMMLEEKAFQIKSGELQFSAEGFMPWQSNINTTSNKLFCDTVLDQSGKAPSIFSLLGWEVALVLQKVIESEINSRNGNGIVQYLLNSDLASPRGEIKLDKQTQHYIAPVIKAQLKGHYLQKNNVAIESIETSWSNFVSNPPQGVVSGWTNTYLCY